MKDMVRAMDEINESAKNISKIINNDWQPNKNNSTKQTDNDAGNINGLKKLWDLPESSIKQVCNF